MRTESFSAPRRWNLFAAAAVGLGAAFAWWSWRPPEARETGGQSIGRLPALVAPIGSDTLTHLAGVVTQRDPFRVDGLPSEVAFDPRGQYTPPPPPPPPPPRPPLKLRGLISGSTPSAVVDGIPGVDGSRVLRLGETVEGLRFEAIRGDSAVFAGYDTLWVLGTPGGVR